MRIEGIRRRHECRIGIYGTSAEGTSVGTDTARVLMADPYSLTTYLATHTFSPQTFLKIKIARANARNSCASVFKSVRGCRIGVYSAGSYATGVREYTLRHPTIRHPISELEFN